VVRRSARGHAREKHNVDLRNGHERAKCHAEVERDHLDLDDKVGLGPRHVHRVCPQGAQELLPTGISGKPDAVIVSQSGAGRKIHIMEFKHTNERHLSDRQQDAVEQWGNLRLAMLAHTGLPESAITITPVVITNLGFLPTNILHQLKMLGLSRPECKRVATELHHHAVNSFIALTNMRYKKLAEQRATQKNSGQTTNPTSAWD
jgi:hypothetical protein